MFEIEKSFEVQEEKLKKLLQEAEFVGQKVFTDVYYDTDTYDLTSKNIWLRKREGSFELKIPIGKMTDTDRYEEIENEQKIKAFLDLHNEIILADLLTQNGYKSFAKLTTTRKKYKHGDFNIDIDNAEFDDGYKFCGMEIELMVKDESKAEEASQKITQFAKIYGLKQSYKGKVSDYLKNKNPYQFKILSDLGIFQK